MPGVRRHCAESRIQAIKDWLGLALGRNVDPTYNKAKCQLLFLSFLFLLFWLVYFRRTHFYSLRARLLFGKVISGVLKKRRKMEHPWRTRDHCCSRTTTYLKLRTNRLNWMESIWTARKAQHAHRSDNIAVSLRCIDYFRIPHNTLCFPPKFCINHCF